MQTEGVTAAQEARATSRGRMHSLGRVENTPTVQYVMGRWSARTVRDGPQADRPTADRRVRTTDPLRNGLQSVVVFAVSGDPVLAVLLCSFTHQPIFGWRPWAAARHEPR